MFFLACQAELVVSSPGSANKQTSFQSFSFFFKLCHPQQTPLSHYALSSPVDGDDTYFWGEWQDQGRNETKTHGTITVHVCEIVFLSSYNSMKRVEWDGQLILQKKEREGWETLNKSLKTRWTANGWTLPFKLVQTKSSIIIIICLQRNQFKISRICICVYIYNVYSTLKQCIYSLCNYVCIYIYIMYV